ncbi:hypothetical protein ACJMK2_025612 [Sinanodonta woodiana]|uniref:Uncharacterized protein n=1 Tax=Sinanodonta woodiana TaxID=1069815 RepID=A0ABD3XH14_SINWO
MLDFVAAGEANLTETFGMPSGKSGPIGLIVILIFSAIPGAIIVFFTYKLVKSLRDKARQKEEKKKLKQQKKEKESQRKPKKK